MSIMFMGDVHGEKKLLEPFLTSSCDILIQLGDFGFIWKNNDIRYNKFIRKFSKNYPEKKILFVPGNHENYNAIEKCPFVKIYGNYARKISENVFALERGNIYNIEGKNFLSIGGAWSIDQNWRIPFVSWWPQEQMSYSEINNFFNRKQINEIEQIDYVITHTAPFEVVQNYFSQHEDKNYSMEKFFDQIIEKHGEKIVKWYCGHWHKSIHHFVNNIEVKIFDIGEYTIE